MLGWCRDTIRKGQHEVKANISCIDNFKGRGRLPAEAHLPGLIDKIHEIVEEKSQADPTLKSDRNLDNGPEQQSHRTQLMKRIQDFSNQNHIRIQLAYYPPYHSKYNPIERTFGILEQHWNGELLDSLDAVYGYAKSMTWKGIHPIVKIIEKTYEKGVKLTKAAMLTLNEGFERLKGLEKWFVIIRPQPQCITS